MDSAWAHPLYIGDECQVNTPFQEQYIIGGSQGRIRVWGGGAELVMWVFSVHVAVTTVYMLLYTGECALPDH